MARETVFQYPGKKATVSWNGRLCIHVGECGRAKGDLFVGGRDPWCQPDLTSNEEVADVVNRCPTGALTVDFADGSGKEQPEPVNTVNVAGADMKVNPSYKTSEAQQRALAGSGVPGEKYQLVPLNTDADFSQSIMPFVIAFTDPVKGDHAAASSS